MKNFTSKTKFRRKHGTTYHPVDASTNASHELPIVPLTFDSINEERLIPEELTPEDLAEIELLQR